MKIICLLLFWIGFSAQALDVPALTGPVVDQAQILSGRTQAELSALLQQFQQQGKGQIQVLTISSLDGNSIEDFSIRVTDKWKLGGKKGDDGVLFIIAVQDRKLRIEVGQGLEGVLPDAYASRIVREVVTPFFKAQRYSDGVTAGVLAIIERIDPEFTTMDRPKVRSRRLDLSGGQLLILFLILGVFGVISRFGGGGGRGFGGRGYGGGFGGGGWSGGGGGFSGGGSSGNW